MRFAGFPFRPGIGSWFFLLVCAVPVSIRGCAGGCIRLVVLLRLGGRKIPASEHRGWPFVIGFRLGSWLFRWGCGFRLDSWFCPLGFAFPVSIRSCPSGFLGVLRLSGAIAIGVRAFLRDCVVTARGRLRVLGVPLDSW